MNYADHRISPSPAALGAAAASAASAAPSAAKKKNNPSSLSYAAAISYNFISVTGFTISIATSERYTQSLGGTAASAGLLVGLFPFLSCFSNLALIPVLGPESRISMRAIYAGCCLTQMAGWTLYASAPVTFGMGAVLMGRALCGLAGVRVGTYYIARAYSHDPKMRSDRMMILARMMVFGYFAGSTLGLILGRAFGGRNDSSPLFNEDTIPGWAMVLLFALEIVFVMAFFEEPPHLSMGDGDDRGGSSEEGRYEDLSLMERQKRQQQEKEHQEQKQDLETEITPLVIQNSYPKGIASSSSNVNADDDAHILPKKAGAEFYNWFVPLLLTYFLAFIIGVDRASWEIVTVFYGTSQWKWDVDSISAYLSVMYLTSAVLSCLGLQKIFKTRSAGLLGAFLLAVFSSLFLLGHSQISALLFGLNLPLMYGIGSLLVQTSAIIGVGNVMDQTAHLGKMKPARNQLIMSLYAVFYSLGRACGSVIAPYLSMPFIFGGQLYPLFVAVINCIGALAAFLLSYSSK